MKLILVSCHWCVHLRVSCVVVDDVKQLAQKLCPELKAVLDRNDMKPAKTVAEMCDAETLQRQAANHVKAS